MEMERGPPDKMETPSLPPSPDYQSSQAFDFDWQVTPSAANKQQEDNREVSTFLIFIFFLQALNGYEDYIENFTSYVNSYGR